MFDEKKISFKENKIKAKYFLDNNKKDVSIVKFNLIDKNIFIKIAKKKDTIEITKDNVAFTDNNNTYKKINMNNINEYLISNIDNNLISKCPKN